MHSMRDAIGLLAARGLDHMTIEELESLAGATSFAENEAQRLAAVCQGLACLVVEDGQHTPGAGSFQDADSVFDLLCSVSHGEHGHPC